MDNLKVVVDEHKYTDFALDDETATASVTVTKGNEADEVVSLIIAEYDSIIKAANLEGHPRVSIDNVLRGARHSLKGYIWKYLD